MAIELDLDDVAAQSPLARKQLDSLRGEHSVMVVELALARGGLRTPREQRWLALYNAVNQMMAPLGCYGTINARDDRVRAVMDALHDIDGGTFRGPEGRAEGQSPAERPLTVTDEAKADSDPAVDLLRAIVNRLMGERDALRDALERLVNDCSTYEAWQRPCLHYDAARSLLAQLDSVAPTAGSLP